jgi:hypothetical protein
LSIVTRLQKAQPTTHGQPPKKQQTDFAGDKLKISPPYWVGFLLRNREPLFLKIV